jgi:hypothetical protein
LLKDSDITVDQHGVDYATDRSASTPSSQQAPPPQQPQGFSSQIPPSIAEDHPIHDFHGEEYSNPELNLNSTNESNNTESDVNLPRPALNRQVSRQRPMRQRQQHKRQATVEDLIQQLDAHERAEKERQEQFDAMQWEEEERIRLDLEEKERQLQQQLEAQQQSSSPTDNTANTAMGVGTAMDHSTGGSAAQDATTGATMEKMQSPLKGLKQRFKTFRRQRHQDPSDTSALAIDGNVSLNPLARKKGIKRSSRFASSIMGMNRSRPLDLEHLAQNVSSDKTKAAAATAAIASQTSKSINRSKLLPNNFHNDILFQDRFDTTTGKPYSVFTAVTRSQLRAGHVDPDQVPPLLFLEEVAHLLSLLSAVAFSTLRNDLPYAESPLTAFEPGLPWPHVDPDAYKRKNRRGWEGSKYRWYTLMRFVVGASRTDRDRTLYNAARPFRVIGNVSDEEINQLQQARGPLAKVSLVSMWVQELISREYQTEDSMGTIAAPIISRLYQFISDGMAGYSQARKIAAIPFPFAHAQLT